MILAVNCIGCAFGPGSGRGELSSLPHQYGDDQELTCRKEKPTGSNRPVTVCRRNTGEFEKEQVKRDMHVLKRQSEQLQ
jgi:hypothetical protein